MAKQRRNRAKVLTPDALKQLKAQIRQHELDENAAVKYSLEKLGELTGLDPETVKKVLDREGADKRSLDRCFSAFGLTLTSDDFISAAQVAPPQIDPGFVGRDEAIADLRELVNRNSKIIVIQARGGVGKTTLARRFLQQEFDLVLEFPIAKETKDIASIESLLEEKLRQLGEEPGREFLVSCDRLKRKLQHERIGILIDNLEPALDSAGRFIEPHRRYVEVLRILADPAVQSTTLITSRERLRETSVSVQPYLLRSLNISAWKDYFQSRTLPSNITAVELIHNAYGGNAKAMEIICGAIAEDFSGDVESYWQVNQADLFIERDLEDLVKQQFDRLQKQNLDAYNLLCRMGCYRYQDVPTVPTEGLICLLWDISEKYHHRVIRILSDRSLVEHDKDYWLHPVIRSEALIRVQQGSCWEVTNQRIAEFWGDSVERTETKEEALKAFEAYYHYAYIDQLDSASRVIMRRRQNAWHPFPEGESLYGSFSRLGMLTQILHASLNVVDSTTLGHQKCRLLFYISSNLRFLGRISESVDYANKCLDLIQVYSSSGSADHHVDSFAYTECQALTDIGNSKIDLWELQEAKEYFQKALNKNVSEVINDICYFRMAFLQACLGNISIARDFAQKSYLRINDITHVPWSRGYRFMSLGYSFYKEGNFKKALELYEEGLNFSKLSKYSQLQGVFLHRLSELLRQQNKLNEAQSKALESIEILELIGAKCELAEAYFQLGLTHLKMGRSSDAHYSFQKSTNLFKSIDAPKQIDRVKNIVAKH